MGSELGRAGRETKTRMLLRSCTHSFSLLRSVVSRGFRLRLLTLHKYNSAIVNKVDSPTVFKQRSLVAPNFVILMKYRMPVHLNCVIFLITSWNKIGGDYSLSSA